MSEVTVWYDGQCPLCRREIAWVRRLDRRVAIAFVDVSTASAAACPMAPDLLLARFHAREDGVMYSGAAAFAAMWRAVPLLRPLGLVARRPLALAVLERAYGAFLKIRPRLQSLMRRQGAA